MVGTDYFGFWRFAFFIYCTLFWNR